MSHEGPSNPEYRVVLLCMEDYSGLGELRWELNGFEPDGELSPLGVTELGSDLDLLDQDRFWEIPQGGSWSIRLGTTARGETIVRTAPVED